MDCVSFEAGPSMVALNVSPATIQCARYITDLESGIHLAGEEENT
jgi:hypothetical protein